MNRLVDWRQSLRLRSLWCQPADTLALCLTGDLLVRCLAALESFASLRTGVVKTFRCAAKQLVIPAHITPKELRDRIADELRDLKPDYRRWWDECCVDVFVASDGKHPRFVVAVDDTGVVYFDDHDDEFATGVLHNSVITSPGLHGELESAIFGMIHYPTH